MAASPDRLSHPPQHKQTNATHKYNRMLPLNHIVGRVTVYQTLSKGGVVYFVREPDMSTLFEDVRFCLLLRLLQSCTVATVQSINPTPPVDPYPLTQTPSHQNRCAPAAPPP